jgi:hypothetical protein
VSADWLTRGMNLNRTQLFFEGIYTPRTGV